MSASPPEVPRCTCRLRPLRSGCCTAPPPGLAMPPSMLPPASAGRSASTRLPALAARRPALRAILPNRSRRPGGVRSKGNRSETVRATLASHGLPTLEGKWYYAGPFDNTEQRRLRLRLPAREGRRSEGDLRRQGRRRSSAGRSSPDFQPGKVVQPRSSCSRGAQDERGRLPVPRVRVAVGVQAAAVARQRRHAERVLQRQAAAARGPRPRGRRRTRTRVDAGREGGQERAARQDRARTPASGRCTSARSCRERRAGDDPQAARPRLPAAGRGAGRRSRTPAARRSYYKRDHHPAAGRTACWRSAGWRSGPTASCSPAPAAARSGSSTTPPPTTPPT